MNMYSESMADALDSWVKKGQITVHQVKNYEKALYHCRVTDWSSEKNLTLLIEAYRIVEGERPKACQEYQAKMAVLIAKTSIEHIKQYKNEFYKKEDKKSNEWKGILESDKPFVKMAIRDICRAERTKRH